MVSRVCISCIYTTLRMGMSSRYSKPSNISTRSRDCTIQNILMEGDGMYPQGFHPVWPNASLACNGPAKKRFTRTKRPPRYYLTGFETSCYFPPSVTNPLIFPSTEGDSHATEQQDQLSPYDAFPADVYCLGNTIRMFLLGVRPLFFQPLLFLFVPQRETQDCPIYGLQFLMPLLRDMTRPNGNRRPTMEEIVARYDRILDMQSNWSLRSRVVYEGDKPLSFPRRVHHWGRQILLILQGLSALPTPR